MPKQPQDRKKKKSTKTVADVTSAASWKTSNKDFEPIALEVPSGNTALVRVVGMPAFVGEGLIPNSLLGIVTAALDAGERGESVDEEKLVNEMIDDIKADPDKLVDMIKMADACTVYCVIKPEVLPAPAPGETRFADKLYVDEVDLDDKLFIMNFAVGGNRDLEPFREALDRGVDSVRSSEGVGDSA